MLGALQLKPKIILEKSILWGMIVSSEGWEAARADHFLLVQGHCLQDFMLHPFKVWMQFFGGQAAGW